VPENLYRSLKYVLLWLPLAALVGLLAGTASALLLVSLAWATDVRESHLWLIAFLPLAGLAVGALYYSFGRAVEAGNNLLLEQIHAEAADPRTTIPFRMTPLILVGTVLTHLFGGSAGREGTALQMGASLADQLARPFRLDSEQRRILLMAGISAGFASVFGVPAAGAIFGLEVPGGKVRFQALLPSVIAAFVGDLTTRAWHVHHTLYRVTDVPKLGPRNFALAALAGVAFGLAAMLFARLTHWLGKQFKRIPWPPLRPFIGGILVAAAVLAMHSTKYIGLGIPTIVAAFAGPQPPWDWAFKLLFTAVTLGAAFKGGEVTPLFFIGATLGNALAYGLPMGHSLLAALGFVAVFAGAANTPLASALMAMELFGTEVGVLAAVACLVSSRCAGSQGIYTSQRRHAQKQATTERAYKGITAG
jgi:H+/Cl- antiporter ClcA